jgi:hypothetical protein
MGNIIKIYGNKNIMLMDKFSRKCMQLTWWKS